MNDLTEITRLAKQINGDLESSGVDLSRYTFYPCIEESGRFRILNRPFDEFGELRQVVASNRTTPVYLLEPKNPANPLKIVNPSELL